MKKIYFLMTFLGLGLMGISQDIQWHGFIDQNWNNQFNWSPPRVPLITDFVLIDAGGFNDPIIYNGVEANCSGFIITPGNTLTLKDGGSLITGNDPVDVAGTFNAEKTMSNGEWHLISSPILEALSGMFPGEFLQNWNSSGNTWTDISSLTELLLPGKGFGFFSEDGTTSYTFSGTPNNGPVVYPYPAKKAGYSDMHLVGNPYPSSIDWDRPGLVETYGAVYRWDPNSNDYNEWSGGKPFGPDQYIAPMQGFFIHNESHIAFMVSNDDRVHYPSTFYKAPTSYTAVDLYVTFGAFKDELTVAFKEDATPYFDLKYDAFKIVTTGNGQSQLYTKHNDDIFAIDALPETEVLQLGFQNNENGTYSIGLNSIEGMAIIELEDTKTNTFHNLTNGAYSFDWNATDSEERFILHLKATGLDELEAQAAHVYAASGNVYIRMYKQTEYNQMLVYDLAGRLIFESDLNKQILQSFDLNQYKGACLVKLIGENQSQTEKIVL